jgi:hypothetical protein
MAGTKIKSVAAGRVEDAWWLTSVGSWTNALVVLATQSVVYVQDSVGKIVIVVVET